MDAAIAAISTPEYFASQGATPQQAQQLSQQARLISNNRGGGFTAEAPSVSTASPAVPGQPALSARAEYDALLADRAGGKINDATWHSTGAARERVLADFIANGDGAQPLPAAQTPGETHPYLGAPASLSDYGLLHGVGDLPEAEVAQIRAQQDALGRLDLNRSVVADVYGRLRTYAAEFEHATPEQAQSRVVANYTRFTQQCAKEGIDATRAEALIGAQIKAWSTAEPAVSKLLNDIVTIGDPTILDYVLQIAIHRASKR